MRRIGPAVNGATGEPLDGAWVPPDDEDTRLIFNEEDEPEEHKHTASCHGAIGELQCGYDEETKSDSIIPTLAAGLVFLVVGALLLSLAIWAIVSIWKAILS